LIGWPIYSIFVFNNMTLIFFKSKHIITWAAHYAEHISGKHIQMETRRPRSKFTKQNHCPVARAKLFKSNQIGATQIISAAAVWCVLSCLGRWNASIVFYNYFKWKQLNLKDFKKISFFKRAVKMLGELASARVQWFPSLSINRIWRWGGRRLSNFPLFKFSK